MKEVAARLKRLATRFGTFATVPILVALAIWFLAVPLLLLDLYWAMPGPGFFISIFHADAGVAFEVTSTVASASITTLGLVYSIVLVVFTTAAGNIGPRLLQRFTSDRTNQITAGLFGGTYLYCLTAMHQAQDGLVPAWTALGVVILATACTFQLIIFVRSAAISVTIDEELAEIANRLDTDIKKIVCGKNDGPSETTELRGREAMHTVESTSSGYVARFGEDALVDFATRHDTVLSLKHQQGDFVLEETGLVDVLTPLSENQFEELSELAANAVPLQRSRSTNADVEFSINLLVEVALRALSPGVNDTFTAITCVDRVSSSLHAVVEHGLRDGLRSDEDGNPRLLIQQITVEALLNSAFGPLRRAARGNVLMTKHILDALGRLMERAEGEAIDLLREQIRHVMEAARSAALQDVDLKFLEQRARSLLKSR